MRRQDLEKLLGGYAAGTLTEEELRALFEAAVADQALFDALAGEEALRDTLADPASRALLLEAVSTPRLTAVQRLGAWLGRPQAWALAASVAGAVVIGVFALRVGAPPPQIPVQPEIALLRPAEPPEPEAKASRAVAPAQPVRGKGLARKKAEADLSAGAVAAPPQPEREVRADLAPAPAAAPAPEAPREVADARATRAFAPPSAPLMRQKEAAEAPATGRAEVGAVTAAAPAPPATENVEVSARAAFLAQNAPAKAARDRIGANIVGQTEGAAKTAPHAGLGLRYSLLRRGLDGRYMEIPPDTPLGPEESARLRVEANEAGYLYVLGDAAPLFTGPVAARRPVLVDVRPGALRAILSRQPDTGTVSTLAERTRFEIGGDKLAVDASAELRPRDQSIYVVNPSSAPDARVLVEIRINSR